MVQCSWASFVAQLVKNLPAMWERRITKLLVNFLDDIILIDHNISYVKVKKKKKKMTKNGQKIK